MASVKKLIPILRGENLSPVGFRFDEGRDLMKRWKDDLGRLTDNEMRTLKCLANGKTAKDLVSDFGVSRTRVDQYIRGLRRKLSSETNAQAIARAIAYGWLTLDDIEIPDFGIIFYYDD